jgi:hypothetical protein
LGDFFGAFSSKTFLVTLVASVARRFQPVPVIKIKPDPDAIVIKEEVVDDDDDSVPANHYDDGGQVATGYNVPANRFDDDDDEEGVDPLEMVSTTMDLVRLDERLKAGANPTTRKVAVAVHSSLEHFYIWKKIILILKTRYALRNTESASAF